MRKEERDMNHPYKKYEKTVIWNSVWMAIEDLVENNDLEELTPREYIVGSICKKIAEEKKLND